MNFRFIFQELSPLAAVILLELVDGRNLWG